MGLILVIALILAVLLCKKVRDIAKRVYDFCVFFLMELGLSKKNAKITVNVIIVVIALILI